MRHLMPQDFLLSVSCTPQVLLQPVQIWSLVSVHMYEKCLTSTGFIHSETFAYWKTWLKERNNSFPIEAEVACVFDGWYSLINGPAYLGPAHIYPAHMSPICYFMFCVCRMSVMNVTIRIPLTKCAEQIVKCV